MIAGKLDHVLARALGLYAGKPGRSLKTQNDGGGSAAADIRQYSTLVSLVGSSEDVPISARVAETWLQGPMGWPPRFEYWDAQSPCAVYETLRDAMVQSTQVMVKYYTTDFAKSRVAPPWDIPGNIPQLYTGAGGENASADSFPVIPVDDQDLAASYYSFFAKSILEGWFGITPNGIRVFFTDSAQDRMNARTILKELLVCDFESVIMCTKHRRNFFVSLVLSYFLFWCLTTVLSFLGIQGPSILLWGLVPTMAFWLAYGVSPLCFPMVPTCLVEDFINITQVLHKMGDIHQCMHAYLGIWKVCVDD